MYVFVLKALFISSATLIVRAGVIFSMVLFNVCSAVTVELKKIFLPVLCECVCCYVRKQALCQCLCND